LLPKDIANHIESLLEAFGHNEDTLGYWEREVARNGIDWIFKARGGDHTNWEAWREPHPWRIPPQEPINVNAPWWFMDIGLMHAVVMLENPKASALDVLPFARKQEILNRK